MLRNFSLHRRLSSARGTEKLSNYEKLSNRKNLTCRLNHKENLVKNLDF